MSNPPRFLATADNASMPAATVVPVLHYPDVRAAAAWLQRAFGFAERLRIGNHRVQLGVGEAAVVLAQGAAPLAGESHCSLMVRVSDVDLHARLAAEAGARVLGPPQSFPYGERQYTALDPAGYAWTFSQTVANVDPDTWGGELVSSGPGAA